MDFKPFSTLNHNKQIYKLELTNSQIKNQKLIIQKYMQSFLKCTKNK